MLKITGVILFPSVVAGIIGWLIPQNIFGSDSTDAFIFACIPVILFYASLYFRAQKEEKASLGVLLAIFAVVVMFWAVFKQNGSALTTWPIGIPIDL
jgi:POT family proton-dependent oligopeptide transporter